MSVWSHTHNGDDLLPNVHTEIYGRRQAHKTASIRSHAGRCYTI
jgi:hypothetical protein